MLRYAPLVELRRAVRRPGVVGQVEVGDPEVEGAAHDGPLALDRRVVPEVVPEAERDGRQLDAATTDPAVGHVVIALRVRPVLVQDVHGGTLPAPGPGNNVSGGGRLPDAELGLGVAVAVVGPVDH